MNIKEIEELVKIVEASALTEMTLKEGDFKITMSKLEHPPILHHGMPPMPPAPFGAPAGAPVSVSAENAADGAGKEEAEDTALVTAPIVGTFYSAPAPDEPAYVKVGDHVKRGQTLCILEAMKLMNEIESDFDCEIEAVLVSNEQKVEYGQPLFRIRKL